MIYGEPLYWIFYENKFAGCIFFRYNQYRANEYFYVNSGDELNNWFFDNIGDFKIKEEFKIELTDTSHEDYDFVMNIIRKNRK